MQHAVDAVAHADLGRAGLDVDVRGAGHGRKFEDVGQHVGGDRFLLRGQRRRDAAVGDAAAELLDEVRVVEQLGTADRGVGRQPRLDLPVGQARQLAERVAIARVHHRDVDGVGRRAVGDAALGPRQVLAHQTQRVRPDVADLQIDERHAPGAPDLVQQLQERQLALLGHGPLDRDTAPLRDARRLVEVFRSDQLEFGDQQLAQLAIGEGEAARLHAARSAKNVRTRSTSISSAMFDLMM